MPDVEYFHNLPQETLERFSNLWNEIKVAGSNNTHIYVGFSVVGVCFAAYVVYSYIKKKKREYWYDFPKT